MSVQLANEVTIGELVAVKASRSQFFEKLGIDYCCGGKRTLSDVCQSKGLNPENVLQQLFEFDASKTRKEDENWNKASIAELIQNILDVHHTYTKEALERLARLVNKVAEVHGQGHPELIKVRHIFMSMKVELDMHMQKEENVLFPYSLQLGSADFLPQFHCGSIQNPIKVMEFEHEDAGRQLEELRRLTSNYTAPEGACGSYRAMMDGLEELEADLHMHIHKENNILFPKVLEAEQKLSS